MNALCAPCPSCLSRARLMAECERWQGKRTKKTLPKAGRVPGMYSVVPFLLLALLVLLPLHSTTPSLAHAPQSHVLSSRRTLSALCPALLGCAAALLHLVFLPHLIITPPFLLLLLLSSSFHDLSLASAVLLPGSRLLKLLNTLEFAFRSAFSHLRLGVIKALVA